MKGLGTYPEALREAYTIREFNAIPYLAYFDIYKNYYANKQEEIGAIIHNDLTDIGTTITLAQFENVTGTDPAICTEGTTNSTIEIVMNVNTLFTIAVTDLEPFDIDRLTLQLYWDGQHWYKATEVFQDWHFDYVAQSITGSNPTQIALEGLPEGSAAWFVGKYQFDTEAENPETIEPKIVTFNLSAIDNMREQILTAVANPDAFIIDETSDAPYSLPMYMATIGETERQSLLSNQEGLLLKTYQSDLFNNWISTEWIDGENGINEITAIDTTGGQITINEINLSNKIFNMLNRIAISGGTYDDWFNASYDHMRTSATESPVYLGGKLANLVFQEVTSTAAAGTNPLGTLAGKGRMGSIKKGGKITVKCDEPGRIIGIVSLVPNIDYSQGNEWSSQLKTMNDYHKPGLDEIGFQNLVTDQMAWFDSTQFSGSGVTYRTAGKQPAWINYMTMVNKVYGAFADQNDQMFMVLNRRYTATLTGGTTRIDDLTTYIDPTKYNHIFADTRLDAMNFWVQIGMRIEARRKMSAKVLPNL